VVKLSGWTLDARLWSFVENYSPTPILPYLCWATIDYTRQSIGKRMALRPVGTD